MKKIILAFLVGVAASKVYAAAVRTPVRYSVAHEVVVRPLDGSNLTDLQTALEEGGYTIISVDVQDNSILASQVIMITSR